MKKNNFVHKIDKEEVNKLPISQFDGEVIIVQSFRMVDKAVRYLKRQQIVGVDTETKPSFQQGEHYPTALLQIATEKRCYLFQLKNIGMPRSLASFFANPNICKVGLAFHDDLIGLKRLRNFEPQNCIDIQKIVLQYGILELGLQKIYAIIFGKKISKSQQLTNWENAVLTEEQARYASTDAWATLLIYLELLQTEQLPTKQWQALKELEHQRQIEHQQQMQAERIKQEAEIQAQTNTK